MEENEGMGIISVGGIGSIDTDTVKDHVVRMLEGGEVSGHAGIMYRQSEMWMKKL